MIGTVLVIERSMDGTWHRASSALRLDFVLRYMVELGMTPSHYLRNYSCWAKEKDRVWQEYSIFPQSESQ